MLKELDPLFALMGKYDVEYDIVEADDSGSIVYEEGWQSWDRLIHLHPSAGSSEVTVFGQLWSPSRFSMFDDFV